MDKGSFFLHIGDTPPFGVKTNADKVSLASAGIIGAAATARQACGEAM